MTKIQLTEEEKEAFYQAAYEKNLAHDAALRENHARELADKIVVKEVDVSYVVNVEIEPLDHDGVRWSWLTGRRTHYADGEVAYYGRGRGHTLTKAGQPSKSEAPYDRGLDDALGRILLDRFLPAHEPRKVDMGYGVQSLTKEGYTRITEAFSREDALEVAEVMAAKYPERKVVAVSRPVYAPQWSEIQKES